MHHCEFYNAIELKQLWGIEWYMGLSRHMSPTRHHSKYIGSVKLCKYESAGDSCSGSLTGSLSGSLSVALTIFVTMRPAQPLAYQTVARGVRYSTVWLESSEP